MADTKWDESVRYVGIGLAENDKTLINCGSEVDKEMSSMPNSCGQFGNKVICKRKKNYCIKCLKKDRVCDPTETRHRHSVVLSILWVNLEKSIVPEQMIEEKCQLIIKLFEQRMQELETKLGNKCDEKRVLEIMQEPAVCLYRNADQLFITRLKAIPLIHIDSNGKRKWMIVWKMRI